MRPVSPRLGAAFVAAVVAAMLLLACSAPPSPPTVPRLAPPPSAPPSPPPRPLGADPDQPEWNTPVAPAIWLTAAGLHLGEPFPVAAPGEPAGPGFEIVGEDRALLKLSLGETEERSGQIIAAIEKMPRPIAIKVYAAITGRHLRLSDAADNEKQKYARFLVCSRDAALHFAAAPDPADLVADAAMSACRVEEDELREAVREMGAGDPGDVVSQARSNARRYLIGLVISARAAVKRSDQ